MWCNSCQIQEVENNFKNWTGENEEIGYFIQQTQLKAKDFDQFIQWMPYEGFDHIKKIGQGGFAKVYEAIWCDGPIWNWNSKSKKWESNDSCKVALKVLEGSKDSTKFLEEISAYVECAALSVQKQTILRCYGISQDPETQDYIMVLEYMPNGNIRRFLEQNSMKCDWPMRISILKDILHGLLTIHKRDLIHRNLHTGNILMRNNFNGRESKIAIADLGQSGPPYFTPENELYGVLPYIAPEVLRGNAYTQASDIYSLGMIMYELISGVPPFSNRAHDQTLMFDICNGLRPEIKNIDKLANNFIKILQKCWDPNPFNRPLAYDLFLFDNYGELNVKNDELFEFKYEIHPGAIYTSRELSIYTQYLLRDEDEDEVIEWRTEKRLELSGR
ncbi:kinase-like domain-containing protein [Glomus cerebriforme]|uniref:Kinase-like domain-containing protein n=1 Tax=Glomus cerebriforme TaxID=658196 RepID=A0A397SX91_9GLOM|nr:kinase-like domain-containing protein [Glomus cerebriforme]